MSVIVPAFNAARFVEASLASVLAQDFRGFEVIVYDDGSTDGTCDLVRERVTDPRVRVYRSARNRGVGYARNRMLELAAGRYVVPHDTDDLMAPGRLTRQARCLDRHPDVGVVLGTFQLTDAEVPGAGRRIRPWIEVAGRWRPLRGLHPPGVVPWGAHHNAAMIRRSLLRAIGGYRLRWEGAEDIEALYRLARRTRFYSQPALAFEYRRHPGAVTNVMRARSEERGEVLTARARRFRAAVRVGHWRVDVVADSIRARAVVGDMGPAVADDDLGRGRLALELRFARAPRRWVDLAFDARALTQLMRVGVTHRVHGGAAAATVAIDPARTVPDGALYHAGLLHPISHLLHRWGATLVHAALLARDGAGVLIVGESGCGKSTLSLALMRRGYAYFSDEHPVLALEDGAVTGLAFANRIAVSGRSLAGFPELRPAASWHRPRRKWYLAPERVGTIGTACRIDLVVFPAFRPDARFTVRRLDRLPFVQRLQRDEYYRALSRLAEDGRAAREAHLRLLLRLAGSTSAFAITYGASDIARVAIRVDALLDERRDGGTRAAPRPERPAAPGR